MGEESYEAKTIINKTPCGSLFVIGNFDEDGDMKLVLARLGKAGGCTSALISAIAALVTEGLAAGADPKKLAGCLTGINCYQAGGGQVSCADAFGTSILSAVEIMDQEKKESQDAAA